MSELEAMGISVQRGFVVNTESVDGVQTSEVEMTQLAFTLPKQSAIQATFSREGFVDRLVKIFKTELQAGDEEFDKVVYIRTDTEEATAAFLKSEQVRASIKNIVEGGGSIELDGPFVKLEVVGHHETEDQDTVTVIRALVGA